jgi:hypothetical protein
LPKRLKDSDTNAYTRALSALISWLTSEARNVVNSTVLEFIQLLSAITQNGLGLDFETQREIGGVGFRPAKFRWEQGGQRTVTQSVYLSFFCRGKSLVISRFLDRF